MEKEKDCFIDCECGKKHGLNTQNIVVCADALDCLINVLKNTKYKTCLLLYDKISTDEIIKIEEDLKSENKCVYKCNLRDSRATLKRAQEIKDMGQDVIIALGGEDVVSMAKYYAYSYDCPLIIYVVDNYYDITFSKFSRLFDGIQFNIYKTSSPQQIFVPLVDNDKMNLQAYYISSKFIAVFDNLISMQIYDKTICTRLCDFLEQTLNQYIKIKPTTNIQQNHKIIWTLIRLGQAMSFYDQTINFFGGDYAVASLMQAQCRNSDFLELETIALKLVINSYACLFNNGVTNQCVNLNKCISELSGLLNIYPTECLKRIVDSSLICIDQEKRRKIGNYMPYFEKLFNKYLKKIFMLQSSINFSINVLKKHKFTADKLSKSLAIAPILSSRPSALHIMIALGYTNKLL